jgi:hypothetical protein
MAKHQTYCAGIPKKCGCKATDDREDIGVLTCVPSLCGAVILVIMCPLQLSLNLGPLPLVNTVTPAFPVNLDLPLSTRPAIDDGLEAGMEAPYLADLHERPEYRVLAGQGNVTVTSAKDQAAERAKQLVCRGVPVFFKFQQGRGDGHLAV